MAKEKKIFVCKSCGNEYPRWQGQCFACKEWNTIDEQKVSVALNPRINKRQEKGWVQGSDLFRFKDIKETNTTFCRKTNIPELDKVLGGGIFEGAVILLGGEPGIGKSTLLSQVSGKISEYFKHEEDEFFVENENILYISGEETESQIKKRNKRLGINEDNLLGYAETNVNRIIDKIRELKPALVIVDSINLIYDDSLQSNVGSVSQIRECTALLVNVAKSNKIPIILICHVTKDGDFSGPKILEHMVDTTLMFEAGESQIYRFLRSAKNRFHTANELGMFEMTDKGLVSISNPIAIFIDKDAENLPGSAIFMMNHQNRNMLLDVQSLTFESEGSYPKRVATGIESNKIVILSALLSRVISSTIAKEDIYVKIATGFKIMDNGIDVPLLMSIISSHLDRVIPPNTISFGEVGLTGNIKNVALADSRLKEAFKLGFVNYVVPKNCDTTNLEELAKKEGAKIHIKKVANVKELAEYVYELK